jgi:ferredoxin
MNEKVLIICESIYHNNTQKLATAMSRKLSCRLINCNQALSEDISQYKVIGLGSGIYFTSHHPKLLDIASKMKSSQQAFLFSTHGRPYLGKYHEKLKTALLNRDISVIGEFSCKGYDCTGPYIIIGGGNKGKPNEKDEAKAANFVNNLLPEYCKNTDIIENGHNIEIHYNECIGCGKCTKVCPMKVLNIQNKKPIIVDESNCIHCSLCKEQCPSQAIVVQHSWKEAIAIGKKHSRRKSL